ncbi:MAG: hypothetical protein IPN59_12680 [Holophaga sp.]|nr:hypothetical protein [Holophaga sp.]
MCAPTPTMLAPACGLPNIKTVRFTFIGDPYKDLTNHMVDAAANVQYSQSLPPNYGASPLQFVQSETGGVEFMYLNTTRPQLSEPQVRQALWLALDRQSAIAQLPTASAVLGATYLPSSSPFTARQPARPVQRPRRPNLLDSRRLG